ncbi:MAG: DNA mismatch repair endonuclease MutL [Capsulimonadaceae bacterium]
MTHVETRIQILDDTTANQIAAGEVVERPAAVVKELVENSLDAGATRVLVELLDGGRRLVRVTDDGCGMGPDDAVLALMRHATSKIVCADDLFRITTMGFRGEALPSIASVSRFTLTTCPAGAPADTAGTQIVCVGGTIETVDEVGARAGTSIAVEDLFYNVPARLKFLKTTTTELSHIIEMVQRFSLAYPEVALRLTHDGREAFTSAGNGGLLDSCVHVYGRETARQLAPLSRQAGAVRVTGFIGTPPTLRGTRAGQHTFVNRRFIRSKAVTRALDESYKSVQTIHGTRYAPAVVLIELEPSLVDVNVSPTKTEVRFTREGDVYSAVYHAVRDALLAGGLVATLGESTVRPDVPCVGLEKQADIGPAKSSEPHDHSFAASLLSVPARPAVNVRDYAGFAPLPEAESVPPDRSGAAARDPFEDPSEGITFLPGRPAEGAGYATRPMLPNRVSEAAPAAYAAGRAASDPSSLGEDYRGRAGSGVRVLAQTRNTYILAQTGSALLVIDQHIAHERVLYEKLVAAARTGGIPVQRLILPLTLELSRREALVVDSRLAELRQAGFDLEPFGPDTFLVRSVPAAAARRTLKAQQTPEAVLREIVDELVEKSASRRMLLPAEEVLITASCKMAVKAGDPLTFAEMETLVADLFQSENPYTCPHGRPILFEITDGDLDRKFGR